MRILIFGPYPQAGQPISGGVMAVVHALAQGLARRGMAVAVASAVARGQDRKEKDGAVQVYHLGIPPLPRTRRHRRIRRKLLSVGHDFQPTIVHAHGTGYYAAAALESKWPTILTAHGVAFEEAKRSRARGVKEKLAWRYDARFEAQVLLKARYVIAINPYIRRAFSKYDHLHWFDIPNPVDDQFFTIQRQPEPGRLFNPARVIPRKGTDLLIRAFIAVADRFPQAQLRIAGETDAMPNYVAHCLAMVSQAGLQQRVQFLGNLDHGALQEEYRRASGVVLASRQETAPVVIGEAFAAGCPVIATEVGGVGWMVTHGVNGLLVPPEQDVALAEALARLLTGNDVLAWSHQARLTAQSYRLDRILDATLAAYERVLSIS